MASMKIDEPETGVAVPKATYLEILRSTALIGGSSLVMLGLSILRNKSVAVLLGPEGVGLLGIYNSIADMTQALAGLGVQSSGVRQIAEAVGTGDGGKVARTAFILKRASTLLGVIGTCMLAAFAIPVAHLTFGNYEHSASIALLSLAIAFRLASAGQTALLQGLRQIASLATVNILAACSTTAITIPFVYFLRAEGIVPALVTSAGAVLLVSWRYSRKPIACAAHAQVSLLGHDLIMLIRLGFVFMVSALLTLAGAYTVRLIVLHHGGIAAAGLYQAAWALGSLYAGFILQAMGTDFYPRLMAISQDNAVCNRLVNEQAQVSILLAGPGVLATLTFAPLAMWLFYSPAFYAASDLLRWICLGMLLRVVAWPMGYIILAKGAQKIFFWTEVAATFMHVGLAFILVHYMNLEGAGLAFFGLYLWHSILIYLIVRRLTGFRWSGANCRAGSLFLVSSVAILAAMLWLPLWPATALGSGAVLAGVFYSLKNLLRLIPAETVSPKIRKWMPRWA